MKKTSNAILGYCLCTMWWAISKNAHCTSNMQCRTLKSRQWCPNNASFTKFKRETTFSHFCTVQTRLDISFCVCVLLLFRNNNPLEHCLRVLLYNILCKIERIGWIDRPIQQNIILNASSEDLFFWFDKKRIMIMDNTNTINEISTMVSELAVVIESTLFETTFELHVVYGP